MVTSGNGRWTGKFGTVVCCGRPRVFDSAELERGWTVGRCYGHFLVADSDAHRFGRLFLHECFRSLDGVNVGTHELFTPCGLLGITAMSDSHRESEMVRTIKGCWRCEQTDCGRAGWTDDFHFSPFAA